MPNPSGDQGVGGDQQATGGSPSAHEAQPAVNPSGGPASAGDSVPRGQFDRIYQKLERTKAELAAAKNQQSSIPSVPEQPDYDAQIAEWQRVADRHFDTDPRKYTEAITQIGTLNAQKIASAQLQQFISQQAETQQRQQFEVENAKAAERALVEFPELKDQNSEFFKQVQSTYDADPYLQRDPSGVLKAARLAWADRSRSGRSSQGQQLEGSRTAPVPASSDSERDQYNKAVWGLKAGDKAAAQQYLAKNFENLLKRKEPPPGS